MKTFRRTRKSRKTGESIQRRRWYVRWEDDLNGLRHVWAGFEESKPTRTEALGYALEDPSKLRAGGEPIPSKIRTLINNLPESRKAKLVELNLADAALLERGHAIDEHLDDWHAQLEADSTQKHAAAQRQRAERVLQLADAETLADLNIPALNDAVAAMAKAPHNFTPTAGTPPSAGAGGVPAVGVGRKLAAGLQRRFH